MTKKQTVVVAITGKDLVADENTIGAVKRALHHETGARNCTVTEVPLGKDPAALMADLSVDCGFAQKYIRDNFEDPAESRVEQKRTQDRGFLVHKAALALRGEREGSDV